MLSASARAETVVLRDSQVTEIAGDPYGTRTRVFAVRGRRPRPLDEGANAEKRGGHMFIPEPLVNQSTLTRMKPIAPTGLCPP
jgi:hypothetical protein